MGSYLWLIPFVITLNCHVALLQVGHTCYMRLTGIPGICKISTDCPLVEEQSRNGIEPTICGYFQLTKPIVCCEGSPLTVEEFHSPTRPDVNRPNPFLTGHNSHRHTTTENPNIYFSSETPSSFPRPSEELFVGGVDNSDDSIIYPNEIPSSNNQNRQRTSEQKCQEYTKPLNDVVNPLPLLTDTDPLEVNIEKCDNDGNALIVGGKPAAPGEFPFMAVLGFLVDGEIDWRCGATLISERYVVSAAHCAFSRDVGPPVVARLGEIDLKKDGSRRIQNDYTITKITPHPNYTYPLRYNDIALMRLDREVEFSRYIRPACLYTSSRLGESYSIATGYGKEEFAAAENINKLMKVTLNIYDNQRCSQTFGNDRRSLPRGIISSMLCAGDLKGGKDTCQGDSGGPLLVTKNNNHCKFYIIGVTSFGKSCGEANTPAVYTRVSEYVSWIENIVW